MSLGQIFLEIQNAARFQQLVSATLVPGSVVKARVLGLLGDKALLSILGEKVFAEAPSVPLAAGQVLKVQVQASDTSENQPQKIQLRILSSETPPEAPAAQLQPEFFQTAKAGDLVKFLNNLKIPADPRFLQEALPLLSEKPSLPEMQAVLLLKTSGMPMEENLFQPLKQFFETQAGREIPLPFAGETDSPQKSSDAAAPQASKSAPPAEPRAPLPSPEAPTVPEIETVPIPVPAELRDPETFLQSMTKVVETFVRSPESKLASFSVSTEKLDAAVSRLASLPQDAREAILAKDAPALAALARALEENIGPDHPLSALLQKLNTLIPPKTGQPAQSGAQIRGSPQEQAQAREAIRESPPNPAGEKQGPQQASAQATAGNKDAQLAATVKNALEEIHQNLSVIANDPSAKLQSLLADKNSPLPPQVQNAIRQAVQIMENHQVGNAILSRQDAPVLSIPIPLTLDGKKWVGYLQIHSDQQKKNLEKSLKEGTFTLRFTVQTQNLGTVQASVAVHENVLDGTFHVKGGEEKKFIEQNTDRLLKRLESLPFKVRSIEARIGEDAKQGVLGLISARASGSFDIRV